jgi:hypothetical protein
MSMGEVVACTHLVLMTRKQREVQALLVAGETASSHGPGSARGREGGLAARSQDVTAAYRQWLNVLYAGSRSAVRLRLQTNIHPRRAGIPAPGQTNNNRDHPDIQPRDPLRVYDFRPASAARRGTLAGYEVREYSLEKWGRMCALRRPRHATEHGSHPPALPERLGSATSPWPASRATRPRAPP